jgi:CelD/BcsL family acetyltransferase involved in cellulose biosynthesis
MRVSVRHPAELAAGELAAWRAMQRASGRLANPFLAPDFALAVAAVKPQARVAVLSDGGEPAGFLAFERGPFGLGRPIGAGVSDAQGVVHGDGLAWDPDELLAGCGLATLEFDHLVDDQPPWASYIQHREPSPIIDLTGGYEAYVARRRAESRSFRRGLARQETLERQHRDLCFEYHSTAPDALAALMSWKSAQYRRTGRVDRFAKPWIRELVGRLMRTRGEEFAGVLAVLRVVGRPIAVQACLASSSVLALWFPAFDPAWARYSPGIVLRRRLLEAAAARGIHYVDMGKGHSPHKELLKTGEFMVAEARVERHGPRALVHRLYRDPPRRVERFVLDHPALRRAARHTLVGIGSVRTRVGFAPHAPGAAGRSSL